MAGNPIFDRDAARCAGDVAVKSVLFVKKSSRISGGHLKFHDYFQHCLEHVDLDPYVYLAFGSERGIGPIWEGEQERVVQRLDPQAYDYVFIDGRDWELLPAIGRLPPVIHLIQDFRHGDAGDPRFAFLARRAWRICVSTELAETIEPHSNGPVVVIPNGVDSGLFRPGARESGTVVVWARKDRELGKEIAAALKARAADVHLLTRPVPREEWAALVARSEVFVGLTKEREGFFLPALEAMASGSAVVCADAIGNRSYCIDGETSRMAQFGSAADHVRYSCDLLDDAPLRAAIVQGGMAIASQYTMERERELFRRFIDEHVLAGAVAS